MLHTSLSLLLQSWACKQGIIIPSVLQNECGVEHVSRHMLCCRCGNFLAINYKASIRQEAAFLEECCERYVVRRKVLALSSNKACIQR